MRIFKKHEKVVVVDENGNPIKPDKKGFDWKEFGKNFLIGAVTTAAGIVVFCLVLASGNTDSDSSSEYSTYDDDGVNDYSTMEPTGTEDTGSSGSEE